MSAVMVVVGSKFEVEMFQLKLYRGLHCLGLGALREKGLLCCRVINIQQEVYDYCDWDDRRDWSWSTGDTVRCIQRYRYSNDVH